MAISNIDTSGDLIKTLSYTYKYTLAAGSRLAINADNFKFTAFPSGYTFVGVTYAYSGGSSIDISGLYPYNTGTAVFMRVMNNGSKEAANVTAKVTLQFMRSDKAKVL